MCCNCLNFFFLPQPFFSIIFHFKLKYESQRFVRPHIDRHYRNSDAHISIEKHQILFFFYISHVYPRCKGVFYCLIVPVWSLYIVVSAAFSSYTPSARHQNSNSRWNMFPSVGPFLQRVLGPADSDPQFGLNDSKELQLAIPGETCLDSGDIKKWKKMTPCPDNM